MSIVKIYIDILFLTDFMIDFILLCITQGIMSVKVRRLRTAVSAFVGAVGSVCFFVFDVGHTGIFSLMLALLMSAAVFCPCNGSELLKSTLAFFAVSFVTCGMLYADIRLFGGGAVKNGIFYASSPRITLIFSAFYIFIKYFFSRIKRRASQSRVSVILEYNGKKLPLGGFYDTGNGLFDPICKKAVILIEESVLKELVASECTAENLFEWVQSERIRIIPYKTVDAEGCFRAIVLDRVYVDGKRFENVTAAVCQKKLKYPVILNVGM